MKALVFVAVLAIACNACDTPPPGPTPPVPPPAPAPTPTPPGPEPPPAPTGDVFDQACANEARIGCPEGTDMQCADVFRRVVAARLTPADESTARCIAAARDRAGVQACGFAECRE